MTKKLLLLSALVVLGFGLTACNRPSSAPCAPTELEPPTNASPGHYTNVGTAPTIGSLTPEFFQWEFAPDCIPEHFLLRFSPDRHFGSARSGSTDGELSWPPSDATWPQHELEPATEYYWNARAWTAGVLGPDSATTVFFTGPLCETAGEMGAPALLSPDPGEVIHELYAELHYEVGEPKCLPEGYFVDLQTDATFNGTNLLAEYGISGTYALTEELADCTTYYWRVAPVYGGAQGPFSETRAFTVAVGPTCIFPAVDPAWLVEFAGPLPPNVPCNPIHLPVPELTWPPHYSYVGEEPTLAAIPENMLQWSLGCLPSGYHILLSTDLHFGSARTGETDGELSWPVAGDPPEAPLEPGSQYYWNVQAWSTASGPVSSNRTFFTGPECADPSALVAPELITPLEGEVVSDVYAELHYVTGEPKCLPDGYFVDLQTVSDFSGTSLLAESAIPSTHILTEALDDCRNYYWRVAAVQDGVYGPFSEVRSFRTNQGVYCSVLIEAPPIVTAIRDLGCLLGPNPEFYPTLGYLLSGENAPIVAQSLDQLWWYIQNPDGFDICAVSKDGTVPDGDTSGLPLWNNPELQPEDGGSPGGLVCSSDLSEADCEAGGWTWVENIASADPDYCGCPG